MPWGHHSVMKPSALSADLLAQSMRVRLTSISCGGRALRSATGPDGMEMLLLSSPRRRKASLMMTCAVLEALAPSWGPAMLIHRETGGAAPNAATPGTYSVEPDG